MGKQGVVRPEELKAKMARINPMFAGNSEHDAHEFCLELLNQLHDELADSQQKVDGVAANGLPTQLFDFTCIVHLKCKSCGYQRERREVYRDLSVDFPSTTSGEKPELELLFSSHFDEEELEYACEECGANHASASRELESCPNILALHVKRFFPDVARRRVLKRSDNISFPLMWSPEKDDRYTLSIIVSHIGESASTGHYVCYAPDDTGWKEFNDSRVRVLDALPPGTGSTAYLLFYVRA